MRTKHTTSILIFCTVMALSWCVKAQVISDSFLSFGQKEIKHNKTSARNEALKECLSDAVRQYVAGITPEKLFEMNHTLLKTELYDNYSHYLKNYRIKEEKEEDGFYKITAEVKLKTPLIDERLYELGLHSSSAKKPSLVVLISDLESVNGSTNEYSWWAKEGSQNKPRYRPIHERLMKRLSLMGFKNISKKAFLSKLSDARIALKKKLIKGDIDTLKRFNAGDVLISGTSSLLIDTKRSRSYPKSAKISVKVINLDSGSRLSTLKKGFEIDWAVRKAKRDGEEMTHEEAIDSFIDSFCAELVSSFLEKWRTSEAEVKIVELNAIDLYSYDIYRKLSDAVSRIKPEVKRITPHSMKEGVFSWHIDINGRSESLASKIARLKIDDRSIDIVNVKPESIEIRVK